MEKVTQVKECSPNRTEVALGTLAKRVAHLRTELDASPQKGQTLMELSPAGMVQIDPVLVDFTDWQQWSQWSRSMEVYQRRKNDQVVCA